MEFVLLPPFLVVVAPFKTVLGTHIRIAHFHAAAVATLHLQPFYRWEVELPLFLIHRFQRRVVAEALGVSRNKVCEAEALPPRPWPRLKPHHNNLPW